MVIKRLTLLPFPFHHHCHLEAHEGRDYLEQVGIYICKTKKLYYKSLRLNTDAHQAVVCPFSFGGKGEGGGGGCIRRLDYSGGKGEGGEGAAFAG